MDYTGGATHIAKWQWDLIHDQGVIVRVFERDKDAMAKTDSVDNMQIRQILQKIKNSYTDSINIDLSQNLQRKNYTAYNMKISDNLFVNYISIRLRGNDMSSMEKIYKEENVKYSDPENKDISSIDDTLSNGKSFIIGNDSARIEILVAETNSQNLKQYLFNETSPITVSEFNLKIEKAVETITAF
jgi:hypothetical protein